MKARALLASLALTWPLCCGAGELVVHVRSESVDIAIRELQFPDTLRQDLVSGLTNRILIRVALSAEGRVRVQSSIDVAIKYDLWDESFLMTMAIDGRRAPARTFKQIDAVAAFLAELPANGLFKSAQLQRGQTFTLRADVLFDPVDRERMDKIRQWVARNSTFPTPGTQATDSGSSPSADLFNKIFEQYAAGADFASVLRQTIVSRPFRLEDAAPGP